jgi:hypothetical protein
MQLFSEIMDCGPAPALETASHTWFSGDATHLRQFFHSRVIQKELFFINIFKIEVKGMKTGLNAI